MSFYEFQSDDIIDTDIVAYPSYTVTKNGDQITGSIYLDRPFIDPGLRSRLYQGFSLQQGAIEQKYSPFSSSISMLTIVNGGQNKEIYNTINSMYDFYSFFNANYTSNFTGSVTNNFSVINIPEIYYDRQIATGSITLNDLDKVGAGRTFYDDGNGGIYSGSLSGTLVGNVFYSEGIIVFKGGGLNGIDPNNVFGNGNGGNFAWTIQFEGQQKIPVKIFRCRAPAGQLNASTNPTFYHIPTGVADKNRNEKEIVLPGATYVTAIGIYNEHYELVGLAKLAQPVKKSENQDILFRLRMDF